MAQPYLEPVCLDLAGAGRVDYMGGPGVGRLDADNGCKSNKKTGTDMTTPDFPKDQEALESQVAMCAAIWSSAVVQAAGAAHPEVFLFSVLQLIIKTMKINRGSSQVETQAYLLAAAAKVYETETSLEDYQPQSTVLH